MHFIASRPMGSAWLLHGLWQRLGIGSELAKLAGRARHRSRWRGRLHPRDGGQSRPRAAFEARTACLVGGRCRRPRGAHGRLRQATVPGDGVLVGAGEENQRAVYYATADLLNLEVDLLLYDTTSSYFEMEDDDEEQASTRGALACVWPRAGAGAHEAAAAGGEHAGLPDARALARPAAGSAQVVVGLAVTREGIPVRCWVWPGHTNDSTTVAEVKASLRGWRLNRVVWAVDRGMVSEDTLRELVRRRALHRRRADACGKPTVEQALSGGAVPGGTGQPPRSRRLSSARVRRGGGTCWCVTRPRSSATVRAAS